ncbi:MAG: CFI-box-CTERM domain-containing protein [Myxococcota bacterium]
MTTNHSPPRRHLLAAILALGAAASWASPALAEISGFSLRSIEEVGNGWSLDSRFGKTTDAIEHFVNIEDCDTYQGRKARFNVTVQNLGSTYTYGVAYAKPGKACPDTHADFDGFDPEQCTVVVNDLELVSNFDFEVDLSVLTGGKCDAGTNADARVYVVVESSTSGVAVQSERIDVTIDLERPASPVLTEIVPADRRLVARWSDDNNDEDGLTYEVYFSTSTIPDDPSTDSNVKSKTGITDKSYNIDDDSLKNDVQYFVRVAAVDDADNMSVLSAQLSQTPVSSTDFWEHYQEVGGTEKGGYCFIATAAYGSPMAGQLDLLRAFRDTVLLPTAPGRAFVSQYYRWGRFAAVFIAQRPALRAVVRVALVPLVWFAALTTGFGLLGGFALLLLAAAALTLTRRRLSERVFDGLRLEARR